MLDHTHCRFDHLFDGGDLSCSALVTALKECFDTLSPNDVVYVTAKDGGAVIDVPAWCISTGHILLEKQPPNYLIRKRST